MPLKFIHMRVPSSTIFIRALSQCGQRSTIPAPRKTCIAPTAPAAPQLPHIMVAVVISTANHYVLDVLAGATWGAVAWRWAE